jgi:transposase
MLGEGRSIAEVAKAFEVSKPTYHRWRNRGEIRWPPMGKSSGRH